MTEYVEVDVPNELVDEILEKLLTESVKDYIEKINSQ